MNMQKQEGLGFGHEISIGDYNRLRQAVGWSPVAERLARLSLDNTRFLAVALQDGRPVGMARVVGDGGYIVYIADVIVLPDCQRSGIGTRLMEQVMQYIRNALQPGEKAFVNLMAAAGKEAFYKRFGFTERPEGALGAGMSMYLAGE